MLEKQIKRRYYNKDSYNNYQKIYMRKRRSMKFKCVTPWLLNAPVWSDVLKWNFFKKYKTTLATFQKVKLGEHVTRAVKQIFDDIFTDLEREVQTLPYEKNKEL